jgi:hypothetical protein
MRTGAICLCLCLMTTQALAFEQTKAGDLAATGMVVGADGQPQPGVPLRVQGPQGETLAVTDAKGKWSLYNLAPGLYNVQAVTKVGNRSAPVRFSIERKPVFDWFSDKGAVAYEAPTIKLEPN